MLSWNIRARQKEANGLKNTPDTDFTSAKEAISEDDARPADDNPPSPLAAEMAQRFARIAAQWEAGGPQRQEVEELREIGRRVKQCRRQQQITRTDLARRAYTTPALVYFLEGGLATTSEVQTILAPLAGALDLTCAELVSPTGKADEGRQAGGKRESAMWQNYCKLIGVL